MKTKKIILTVCCFFIATINAQEVIYDKPESLINSTNNASSNKSLIAIGDLDGDNLNDAAVLVVTENKSLNEQYEQLYILLSKGPNKYSLAEKTDIHNCGGQLNKKTNMHECFVESMEIKDNNLFIEGSLFSLCVTEITTDQFKLYKGEWRLIGEKITNYNTRCSNSGDWWSETDINMLTGYIIEHLKSKQEPLEIMKGKDKIPNKVLLRDYRFIISSSGIN